MTQRELERMETAHRIGQGVDKEKSIWIEEKVKDED
jgi:hypothetical protein